MTHTPGAASADRATLSRDLADFLIELSIALHKHAMYPPDHPSLAPAAAAVARRAGLLLDERSTLSLGVARQQLVIEGVATDPKHPVLAELAGRLHRHHIGAVTFRRGADAGEVASVLRLLAVEAERSGQPLGLGPADALRAWPHVQLHPLAYERLELVDESAAPASERGARAAQLWVGLARAALAAQPDDAQPTPTEPAVIARAIDEHQSSDAAAYDQVIVGYLLQIAQELKDAGSAEAAALRRRTSRLIRALSPDTLRRLVDMGGDFVQRRNFVADATDGMAADAVVELLKAAAQTSQQSISHSLVRMLTKLAVHAETGADPVRPQADAALREQIQRILQGWTLSDPNPGAYGVALQRMSRSAPDAPLAAGAYPLEPDRVVAMALEVEAPGPRLSEAVTRILEQGRLGRLLDALGEVPPSNAAAAAVWERVATVDAVRGMVAREPVDFPVLERLLPRVGVAAAEPLLDMLAASESRHTRHGLLAQLAKMGAAIGPLVAARAKDRRWYVTRNMLALLDELPEVPPGFSPAPYAQHDDPRVRREAVRLQLKLPAERDAALLDALRDPDPRTARLALTAARETCPDPAVPLLIARALDPQGPTDLRVLAIRALGATAVAAALDTLLRLTDGGRTLFGRRRLATKSPELLAALGALASGWSRHPRADRTLALAAGSNDREIRAAVRPGGPA